MERENSADSTVSQTSYSELSFQLEIQNQSAIIIAEYQEKMTSSQEQGQSFQRFPNEQTRWDFEAEDEQILPKEKRVDQYTCEELMEEEKQLGQIKCDWEMKKNQIERALAKRVRNLEERKLSKKYSQLKEQNKKLRKNLQRFQKKEKRQARKQHSQQKGGRKDAHQRRIDKHVYQRQVQKRQSNLKFSSRKTHQSSSKVRQEKSKPKQQRLKKTANEQIRGSLRKKQEMNANDCLEYSPHVHEKEHEQQYSNRSGGRALEIKAGQYKNLIIRTNGMEIKIKIKKQEEANILREQTRQEMNQEVPDKLDEVRKGIRTQKETMKVQGTNQRGKKKGTISLEKTYGRLKKFFYSSRRKRHAPQ